MNAKDLAKLMLEYQEELSNVRKKGELIAAEVLRLGKSQQVGNLRATYYGPRKTYDYTMVQDHAPVDLVAEHSTTILKTDWKKVCEALNFDPPYTEAAPRVVLKLDEEA